MTRLVLSEDYPRQQTFTSIGKQFADRLNEFFGGWSIDKREIVSTTDWEQKEYLELSNGRQLNIILVRSEKTFEVTATASYAFNDDYLEKFTLKDMDYLSGLVAEDGKDLKGMEKEETFNYLCTLAIQRSLSLVEIPATPFKLSDEEKIEEEKLSYLVPKLMIVTGQAMEKNFSYE